MIGLLPTDGLADILADTPAGTMLYVKLPILEASGHSSDVCDKVGAVQWEMSRALVVLSTGRSQR